MQRYSNNVIFTYSDIRITRYSNKAILRYRDTEVMLYPETSTFEENHIHKAGCMSWPKQVAILERLGVSVISVAHFVVLYTKTYIEGEL